MTPVWTHGTWTVKPGDEDAFVAAWARLVRNATEELGEASKPTLLRDRDRPNVFVSFGPWPSLGDVERFRASTAFGRSIEQMRELLVSFEPRTMDELRPLGD